MWISRLSASLQKLGHDVTSDLASEEAESVSGSITAHSVLSRSSFLERTRLAPVRERGTSHQSDEISVISSYSIPEEDPRSMVIAYERKTSASQLAATITTTTTTSSLLWQRGAPQNIKDQLEEKDTRVKELEHLQKLDREELKKVRKEFIDLKLKYQKESKEWKLRHEDYLTQTHRLNERIEAYDRDLNDDEMMHQFESDIINGAYDSDGEGNDLPPAPNVYHMDEDNQTVGTTKSNKTTFSLPSWGTMGGSKRRKERDEGQQQAEQEYMEMLQTKLLKSKRKMQVLVNQCELLDETLEEETKILRSKLKVQEEDKCKLENEWSEKNYQAEYQFKQKEQQLLAKVMSKQEQITRLEDLVDELRDAADMKSRGALDIDEFASIVALNSMKESFDVLSKKKDAMEADLGRQILLLKGELKRLQNDNEKQEKLIDRLEFGDSLTALELDTTIVTTESDNEEGVTKTGANKDSKRNIRGEECRRNLQLTASTKSLESNRSGELHSRTISESKSLDTSIDGASIPSDLKDDINDLMDSISLFADVNDLVGLSDCPAPANRRRSLMLRRPEHPVDSTSFRRESMQVQENKWSMMDDDIRKKQQRRLSRFL